MLSVKRECTNRIITRALAAAERPLLGWLLPHAENFTECASPAALATAIAGHPQALIVHNQHDDALAAVSALDEDPGRVFIEIRQEIRGVLGLAAYRRRGARIDWDELLLE